MFALLYMSRKRIEEKQISRKKYARYFIELLTERSPSTTHYFKQIELHSSKFGPSRASNHWPHINSFWSTRATWTIASFSLIDEFFLCQPTRSWSMTASMANQSFWKRSRTRSSWDSCWSANRLNWSTPALRMSPRFCLCSVSSKSTFKRLSISMSHRQQGGISRIQSPTRFGPINPIIYFGRFRPESTFDDCITDSDIRTPWAKTELLWSFCFSHWTVVSVLRPTISLCWAFRFHFTISFSAILANLLPPSTFSSAMESTGHRVRYHIGQALFHLNQLASLVPFFETNEATFQRKFTPPLAFSMGSPWWRHDGFCFFFVLYQGKGTSWPLLFSGSSRSFEPQR